MIQSICRAWLLLVALCLLNTCPLVAAGTPVYASFRVGYNCPFDGRWRPVAGLRVAVFTLDGRSVCTTDGSSDDQGYIRENKPLTNQQGHLLADGQKYLVGAIAQNEAVTIHYNSETVSQCLTGLLLNHGDAAVYPVREVLGLAFMGGTCGILVNGFAAISLEAFAQVRTMTTQLMHHTPAHLDVYWNLCESWYDLVDDSKTAYIMTINESNSFMELLAEIMERKIVLFSEGYSYRQQILSTIGHEYGHYVHYELNASKSPDEPYDCKPKSHTFETVNCDEFAFKEGWAEFYAGVFLDYSLPGGDFYRDYYVDRLEAYPHQHPQIRSTANEGHVAAYLWDLYDNSPDGGCENVVKPLIHFAEAIERSHPNTVQEFASSFWQTDNDYASYSLFTRTFNSGMTECMTLRFSHYGSIGLHQDYFIMTLNEPCAYPPTVSVRLVLEMPDDADALHTYELFSGNWRGTSDRDCERRGSVSPLDWPTFDQRRADGVLGNELGGRVFVLADAVDYAPYTAVLAVSPEPPVTISRKVNR